MVVLKTKKMHKNKKEKMKINASNTADEDVSNSKGVLIN